MKADVGDRLVIRGRRVGDPDRTGEVLEVRGPEGPYLVQWSEDEHVGLFFPSAGTFVERKGGERQQPS
jgi:hypothetical protein